MDTVNKKALRGLAEKATPGPWARDEGNDVSVSEDGDEGYWEWQEAGPAQFHDMRREQAGADADFCAAANPDTVLALLDEIEVLQAECERLRKTIRRLCNIYVVDDYYSGDIREEKLSRAVERAIYAAMQETSHDNQKS